MVFDSTIPIYRGASLNNMSCETPEIYCCDKPKARREHKCCECAGTIFKGEIYHRHHGIFDGDAFTYKVCVDCENLRAEVDKDCTYVEERTAFDYLYESVFERRDLEEMRKFLEIKTKRNASIPQWMKDRFDEEFNKNDNEPESSESDE
jgi:hypothetical protein